MRVCTSMKWEGKKGTLSKFEIKSLLRWLVWVCVCVCIRIVYIYIYTISLFVGLVDRSNRPCLLVDFFFGQPPAKHQTLWTLAARSSGNPPKVDSSLCWSLRFFFSVFIIIIYYYIYIFFTPIYIYIYTSIYYIYTYYTVFFLEFSFLHYISIGR